MVLNIRPIVMTSPSNLQAILPLGLPVAHLAYRIGSGAHLLRSNLPATIQNGLMVIDDSGFDGRGDSAGFCREVLVELDRRRYQGVIAAFQDRPRPLLKQILVELSRQLASRKRPIYVPEAYAGASPQTKVLISSALSGGSLARRLQEAVAQYGNSRIVLSVDRMAADFFLPAPSGQGQDLTPAELSRLMEKRNPTCFFSADLCVYYFTYMNQMGDVHFVLYDNEASIRRKLEVAQSHGISQALFLYEQLEDLWEALFPIQKRSQVR